MALEELATYCVGEIAEEAHRAAGAKAGEAHPAVEVELRAMEWPADGSEPGGGSLLVHGEAWQCSDYREELTMKRR